MTVHRAAVPATNWRSKPGRTHPGSRVDRRAARRVGRQVRGIVAAVALGITVSAAGFAARPLESPAGSASASGVPARPVDLSRAETIAAKRAAIARPGRGSPLDPSRGPGGAAARRGGPSRDLARHTNVDWDGIARCETGGNWHMSGSTFSGGLGFANSTWSGFGGRQFAPNAGMASREQQIVVAERVYARYGLSGWGCRRYG